jgi:tetratricopeptide (TPR) repeat protein
VQEHTVSFFTEDHPWQAIIVHSKCAQNFMDSGRYRQALEELTTALHLSEEINGKNAITTVWIQMLLAECYYRLNNFKICSQILANILANTRHLPLPTRITAHEEYLYGMALTHEHKNVQAERALKNGINMWINSCSGHNLTSERTGIYANLPDRPLTEEFTMAVARLGDIEMFLHDYQAATHYYNRVAQYSRDSDSTTDSTKELNADQVASLTNEAIAYDRLGQCALLQGNLAAAPAHYAKAVYTMKRAVGGKSALVGAVTRDYAAALWKTGRYLDFLYQQYKAMDIFAKAK